VNNSPGVGADDPRVVAVNLDEARTLRAGQHHAVLTTMRQDGTPEMSPVLVVVDDEGRVIISGRETAYMVKNLRRDPRVGVRTSRHAG